MMRMRMLVLAVVAVAPAAGRADDAAPPLPAPTARFVLEPAAVRIAVERDGVPVPNARVRVVVARDLVERELWAEGELDAAGRGSFPRPPGGYCQVVFDLGNGPAAPIPLNFFDDGTLIPADAVVKDGTAACCVTPGAGAVSAEPPRPTWRDRWPVAAAVVGVNAVLFGWLARRPRRSPGPLSDTTDTNP